MLSKLLNEQVLPRPSARDVFHVSNWLWDRRIVSSSSQFQLHLPEDETIWHGKAAKKLLHMTVYGMACVWVEIKYPKSNRQREREREPNNAGLRWQRDKSAANLHRGLRWLRGEWEWLVGPVIRIWSIWWEFRKNRFVWDNPAVLAEFQCDCDVQHSQCFNVPGLAHLDLQCLGSWRSAIGRTLVSYCINYLTCYKYLYIEYLDLVTASQSLTSWSMVKPWYYCWWKKTCTSW